MQITEQELAKGLAEKQNLLSSTGYPYGKLVPFHPETARQRIIQQDHIQLCDETPLPYANSLHNREIGSRKRHIINRNRGRQISVPFSKIWTVSQEIREQVVHASGVKETVEEESQLIMYPSKWLARLGIVYGVKLSILASRGWQYSFQPFRAVPESSLIFEFCREGNLSGVRTLLSRGDSSPYDRDPLGRTPLWYAALHHQLDISTLLLSEGADVNAMDWVRGRTPIDMLYHGDCEDVKVKIAMANILAQYNSQDDDIKFYTVQRFMIFFRHNKMMDLPPSKRNEAALSIVQHISSFHLQTHPDLSGLIHNYLLALYYDGPPLWWVLRNIPGKLSKYDERSNLHLAIRNGLLMRDPLAMKLFIEKSTIEDLHIFKHSDTISSYNGGTPTSLAMYNWEGFLVWRALLRELQFDMSDFITRELEARKLNNDGWTQETLTQLFNQDLVLPKLPPLDMPVPYDRIIGSRFCDRCRYDSMEGMHKVDLEWRCLLRSIRTGKHRGQSLETNSAPEGTKLVDEGFDISDNIEENVKRISHEEVLPYRIVCSKKCEDGVCVAWECEDFGPSNFPPYIPPKERKRLEQLRLLEEEAQCPTYTMPGAFKACAETMKGLMGSKTNNASKKQNGASKVRHRITSLIKNVLVKAHIIDRFNTFHQFLSLPPELQLKIWEMSLERRPICLKIPGSHVNIRRRMGILYEWRYDHWQKIISDREDGDSELSDISTYDPSTDYSTTDDPPYSDYSDGTTYEWATTPGCSYTPAILHVSRNVREIGLRYYQAQNPLEEILRKYHAAPRVGERFKGRLQFSSHSSKAMYISRTHDLWCWIAPFWYSHYSEMTQEVKCFIRGFLHELTSLKAYDALDKYFIPENGLGDEKFSPKGRRTVIVHMGVNEHNESQEERRRQFIEMTENLRLEENPRMEFCDTAGAGIFKYHPVDLKCSRFGFCKECLKATKDFVEEDEDVDRHTWSIPKRLPKLLHGPAVRKEGKCKSPCELTNTQYEISPQSWVADIMLREYWPPRA
ncbi:hypothetical protein NHQ30_002328 [Ciborinia camelliae]|nr:hypothetical protein NHQ30_002328 [Ciborinia camelliae]